MKYLRLLVLTCAVFCFSSAMAGNGSTLNNSIDLVAKRQSTEVNLLITPVLVTSDTTAYIISPAEAPNATVFEQYRPAERTDQLLLITTSTETKSAHYYYPAVYQF